MNSTFMIYHANPRHTGSALELHLSPATPEEDGRITATLANQEYPQCTHNGIGWNWPNGIEVDLLFSDICKMLQVFRGEIETLEDGKGIYKRNAECEIVIRFSHMIEPVCGYLLDVCRTDTAGNERRVKIILTPWEALGICEAFTASMSLVCFGTQTEAED